MKGQQCRDSGTGNLPPRRKLKPRSERLGRLGRAIEDARKQAGISQEELAHRSGVHATHVSGLERGARNPTYETLGQIADALDMELGQLVTEADKVDGSE